VATQSFSAQIAAWCQKVPEAAEAVFKGSTQDVVEQMSQLLTQMVYEGPPAASGYKRTGFLRASLLASSSAMPALNRSNPGAAATPDFGQIEAVIAGSDLGDTIYLGYTAEYGAHVHYGANGQAPRPWVTMAAQRWPAIVDAKAAEVRQAFGL
jgi:hypothetical protein